MWPFQKRKLTPEVLSREINDLSKELQGKIETEAYPTNDPGTAEVAGFLNSLSGNPSDAFIFQTVQLNFARAVERYKHNESQLLQILQDWRESLLILRTVLNGNEDRYPQIKIKTLEIERRLKSQLGNDYVDLNKSVEKSN